MHVRRSHHGAPTRRGPKSPTPCSGSGSGSGWDPVGRDRIDSSEKRYKSRAYTASQHADAGAAAGGCMQVRSPTQSPIRCASGAVPTLEWRHGETDQGPRDAASDSNWPSGHGAGCCGPGSDREGLGRGCVGSGVLAHRRSPGGIARGAADGRGGDGGVGLAREAGGEAGAPWEARAAWQRGRWSRGCGCFGRAAGGVKNGLLGLRGCRCRGCGRRNGARCFD